MKPHLGERIQTDKF